MGNYSVPSHPGPEDLDAIIRAAIEGELRCRVDAAISKAKREAADEIDSALAEVSSAVVLKIMRRMSSERMGTELLIHVQLGKQE